MLKLLLNFSTTQKVVGGLISSWMGYFVASPLLVAFCYSYADTADQLQDILSDKILYPTSTNKHGAHPPTPFIRACEAIVYICNSCISDRLQLCAWCIRVHE